MVKELLHHDEAPIVALASGQGPSAIALLRVSGRGCHDKLLSCLRKKSLRSWNMNHQSLCQLFYPETSVVLDEVMVTLFRAPYSYTGQDAAEVFLHGSPYIVQAALKLFYKLGFRHAEPGEFTRRAYLSGKIDLSEAEGIHDLISSYSEQQWFAARQLYSGKLKNLVDQISQQLIEAIAWLEASIDFPEEDDTSRIHGSDIKSRVQKVECTLEDLLATYSNGKVATEGLRVAFFGEPNVGKSTLMNTLLNSERAIVTDIPGTTRDYLEETCLINGRLIRLIDTAGIRESSETIEQMGIQRTYEIAKKADLVLFLSDHADNEKVKLWLDEIGCTQYLKVHTKSDLSFSGNVSSDWIKISCHREIGIDDLKEKIQSTIDSYLKPLAESTFISSLRHKTAVEQSLESIHRFYMAIEEKAYDEILAFELHQAMKELRSIVGEISSDQILDKIFSTFCVGK